MNTEMMTESWPGSLGHLAMGGLSTFKEEPSDKESHDEMMDIIKEAYAMEGGQIGIGEDFFGDIKKPQQDKQKPFGYSDDDIMETWLQSNNDFHHTFHTQLHPFTHILPVDDKEHIKTSDVSKVKNEELRIVTSDSITDARNESAMNFLLNSCVEVGENAAGSFEGIQATDMCSLLEQFETVSAQLEDESTNVTPSVSENVTPAVSANVSPCVSTNVTPCASACVTPAISAPPSPLAEVMDAEENIIVNVVDMTSDSADETPPSEPETRKVPKLTIKREPNLTVKNEKPKRTRITKEHYLARMKNRLKQDPVSTPPKNGPKLSLIKLENTPTVSPACTPPSTPPPEVIEKIRSSNKRKSAILLPMGMPSKRGRGQAMSMPVHCTTPKMQKLVKQNYGTPMQPSISHQSISALQKKCEQPSETLVVLDHDYCFMGKSGENSQALSEVNSVPSASSNVKTENDDSNSHASDINALDANINLDLSLDSGSVLKALLISGNRENTQKALAEVSEQNMVNEQSALNMEECVDAVQVNVDEIENFEMTETKAVQSTQTKNTFKGKDHRNYRKKNNEREDKTFDKVPGYFTTLSRPLKSSKPDILEVCATTEQQTIERDVSPERQNNSGFSKLPAYHNCFTNSTKYDRGAYMLSAAEEEAIRNAVLGQRRRSNRRSRSSYSSRSASSSSTDSSRSPSRSRSNSRTGCRSRSGSRFGSRKGSKYGSRHGSRSKQGSRYGSTSRNGSRSRHGSRSRNVSRSRIGSRSHSRAQSRSRMNRKPYNSRKYSNRHPRSRSRSWSRSRSRSRSYSRSRSRSLSSERGPCHRRRRSRSPSYELYRDDDKNQQIEERRIIYVGNIPAEYTRVDLEKRFERFGEIEDISVHFREHGDNYGFVTFAYTCDAYAAKENGNKIPGLPKFDLCFGGRRQFCKSDYADLDGNIEIEEEYNVQPKKTDSMDFDMLLKMAKQKLKR